MVTALEKASPPLVEVASAVEHEIRKPSPSNFGPVVPSMPSPMQKIAAPPLM